MSAPTQNRNIITMSTNIVNIMNRNPHIENRSSSLRHFRSPTKNNKTPRNITFAMKMMLLSIGMVCISFLCVESGPGKYAKRTTAICGPWGIAKRGTAGCMSIVVLLSVANGLPY